MQLSDYVKAATAGLAGGIVGGMVCANLVPEAAPAPEFRIAERRYGALESTSNEGSVDLRQVAHWALLSLGGGLLGVLAANYWHQRRITSLSPVLPGERPHYQTFQQSDFVAEDWRPAVG